MPDIEKQIERAAELATEARTHAYAPYSDFPMGAAVIGEDGAEFTGVLVENVSLGLAMCAERVALFSSVSAGVRPHVLALCSDRTEDELTYPCGACLQVALELGDNELVVVVTDPDGARDDVELATLLPHAPSRHHFTPE